MSNFRWNPRLYDDAMKAAGRGLTAATIFLTGAVKETLSVPAPRIIVTDKTGARRYVAGWKLSDKNRGSMATNPYFAGSQIAKISTFKFGKGGMGPAQKVTQRYQTAPAIKGDPPRKLSGRLRTSIAYEMLDPMKTFEGGDVPTKGRVGTNVKYARPLEFHRNRHEYLTRTANKFQLQIRRIVEQAI